MNSLVKALTTTVADNFTAKGSGGWKTFGMTHTKTFLHGNKRKANSTYLAWKRRNGWKSLTRSPANGVNSLNRKKTPLTRANRWVFIRMRTWTRDSSFGTLRVTHHFYTKYIMFTTHLRFNVLRLASIQDTLESGRILVVECMDPTIKSKSFTPIEAPLGKE